MNVQPQWLRSLSNYLRKAIIKKMPFLFWQIAYKDEREIELLPILCSREKTSIDVGANFGMFASFLIKNSKQCILFEPIPDLFTMLSQAFARHSCKVHPLALSNQAGQTKLRMPRFQLGYSTIEASNFLENKIMHPDCIDSFIVKTARLDDFLLEEIGFIKIDVEGHEIEVLQGSVETIKKSRPNFLIEIENRHRTQCNEWILDFFNQLKYKAYAFVDRKLELIEEYSQAAFHKSRNLIFIAREKQSHFLNEFDSFKK